MDHLFAVKYSYLIPLLPLIGAAISGFFGARFLKQRSHWPIWLGVGASAVMSISLMVGMHPLSKHEAAEKRAVAAVEGAQAAQDQASHHYPLAITTSWYTWISAGSFRAEAGAYIDPLTAVMLVVVTGIGFFICVFSKGYMAGEAGYFRFFAYLGLFIFAMTMLVLGNNFIMLYLGWEGVGLCSYLLIGYYYEKPAAREAAKKAFLVNRVGDFGFGLGIMLIFLIFGTVSFFGAGPGADMKHAGVLELVTNPEFLGSLPAWKQNLISAIPFLLMIGAFGKSAQFPLYVWLPDAMEGPTPVSALIHAATMVTAGIYMIVRCGTLFVGVPAAMTLIAAVGAFTAIFAATIALRQFDLKKVFAYSTISQLGFMFVGVGCLAPVAGAFHLVTHAFFKALLFLSSGVVMHAMAGELDMRKMSGLKRVLPLTRILMLIGCLALAGFPFLSGFFSKDEIVGAAWERSKLLGVIMLFTAFLTAYYTFRLYFRVFEGPELIPAGPTPAPGHELDAEEQAAVAHAHGHDVHAHDAHGHDAQGSGHHNHEPIILMVPLIVLAIGALFAGYLNYPGEQLAEFLGQSPSLHQSYLLAAASRPDINETDAKPILPFHFGVEVPESERAMMRVIEQDAKAQGRNLMIISGLISVLGILLAYQLHLKDRRAGDRLAAENPGVTEVLENKYWIDEIYQAAIVEPLRGLGRVFFTIDRFVVDGVVWLVGFVPQLSGFALKLTTQQGYLQGYAVTMLFGVAVILLIVFL
ncbi:MAG TPA: NADH-quinone oxidoreductase subunit L [Tepidisphaeraceae bacterium]|jgi:NADH-quinone oxidoreductase subunit L